MILIGAVVGSPAIYGVASVVDTISRVTDADPVVYPETIWIVWKWAIHPLATELFQDTVFPRVGWIFILPGSHLIALDDILSFVGIGHLVGQVDHDELIEFGMWRRRRSDT